MGGSDAALSRPKRVNDIIEMAVSEPRPQRIEFR